MIERRSDGWYFKYAEDWYGPFHYSEAEIGLELANEGETPPIKMRVRRES
jgi:hypothetical protein